MLFRQREIPYKFHKVYSSITCEFDIHDSKSVLAPKCSPVEYNQSFFETFKFNATLSNLDTYFSL